MDSNPLATPADTIAALRTRYTGELAVADAATPGPWEPEYDGQGNVVGICTVHPDGSYNNCICDYGVNHMSAADYAHVCAARESVPRDARLKLALLDQVEAVLVHDPVTAGTWARGANEQAIATLRLLAESAGEEVAW